MGFFASVFEVNFLRFIGITCFPLCLSAPSYPTPNRPQVDEVDGKGGQTDFPDFVAVSSCSQVHLPKARVGVEGIT